MIIWIRRKTFFMPRLDFCQMAHVYDQWSNISKERLMVFHVTFNNTSVISWLSVLWVADTRVPGENHRPAVSHGQAFTHNVVSSTPRFYGFRAHSIGGDRHWLHSSCKSNYHKITNTMPLQNKDIYIMMIYVN